MQRIFHVLSSPFHTETDKQVYLNQELNSFMKKILVSLAALMMAASVTTVSAQAMFGNTAEDYRIGIQLGGNAPSFAESDYDLSIGWNFGVTGLLNAENFIPNSYVRGSVLYTRKGASASTDELSSIITSDALFHLHYFEIPVRFGYAYDMGNDVCILGETGPYVAMRLGGSLRCNTKVEGVTAHYSGDIDEIYDDLRRFDIGWGIHAGVCFNQKYQLMLGYDWGLCDAIKQTTGSNRNLSLNLVVYFD